VNEADKKLIPKCENFSKEDGKKRERQTRLKDREKRRVAHWLGRRRKERWSLLLRRERLGR